MTDTQHSRAMRHRLASTVRVLAVASLLLAAACRDDAPSVSAPELPDPPSEPSPTGDEQLHTIYVPAYSHLPRGPGMRNRSMLAILLSVRNVDSNATVTLTHVDYYDTYGHRVRRFLAEPKRLRPLETAEFTIEMEDEAGGSGANFLVFWEGPSDTHKPLAETIMVAQLGSGHVAFTSRGVELDRRPSADVMSGRPVEPSPDEASPDEAEATPSADEAAAE